MQIGFEVVQRSKHCISVDMTSLDNRRLSSFKAGGAVEMLRLHSVGLCSVSEPPLKKCRPGALFLRTRLTHIHAHKSTGSGVTMLLSPLSKEVDSVCLVVGQLKKSERRLMELSGNGPRNRWRFGDVPDDHPKIKASHPTVRPSVRPSFFAVPSCFFSR